jgi:FkbM family methyltransferase
MIRVMSNSITNSNKRARRIEMKDLIKRLAQRTGLVVATSRHLGARYVVHPPRSIFELMLLRHFSSLEGLRFIQVGANDGRRFDPIHEYVERYRWHGVLVEPVPFIFSQLQATYSANSRLQLVRAALDIHAGERVMYSFSKDSLARLPEWVWGMATFNRGQLLETAHALGLNETHLETHTVPTMTWSDLWGRTSGDRCDVLILDTEGYDITLLRAADLRAHLPTLIHFEHMHIPAEERLAFYGELLELGYQIATDEIDTTAWRPRVNPNSHR